jgi:hypothetical protein
VTPHAYAAVSAESTPATAHDGTNGSNPLCSSAESVSALNPRARREEPRSFAAVRSCVGTRERDGLAANSPLFRFFSDGHWGSPTSKAIRKTPADRDDRGLRVLIRVISLAWEQSVLLGPVERQIECS